MTAARKVRVILIAAVATAATTLAFAQPMTSTNYKIDRSVFASGGQSNSTNYELTGAIAQPAPIGEATSPNYQLVAGFIVPISTPASPESCTGDFDFDGDVDGRDLNTFSREFGSIGCGAENICLADFDNDGDVDGRDLNTFSKSFGNIGCLN